MPRSSFHIVADENIPYVEEAFGALGRVLCLPGRQISSEDVRDADVLLVRSVTPVGAPLLDGSRVRFVGSATIGTDHVDRDYLVERGIAFAHAPGSNAGSVVEYVLAALCYLATGRGESLHDKTVGIVGCGNVGGALAERLPALGMRVLVNDPPLAERAGGAGRASGFVSLDRVATEADVLTLHVPLEREGPHPTFHLVDDALLNRLQADVWLFNTSRGAVVDNRALRRWIAHRGEGAVVLDVWEGEPAPDVQLVAGVDVATPHIAGYSFEGKVRGTIMLYEALTSFLGAAPSWDYEALLQAPEEDSLQLEPPPAEVASRAAWLHALVRQMYDLAADDARMRRIRSMPATERGSYFSRLRKHYPRRRAFERHRIAASEVPAAYREAVEEGLGVQCV